MRSKKRVFVMVMLLIAASVIIKGRETETGDDVKRFKLDEKYYVGDSVEYGPYIVELSHSMYDKDIKTGYCIFKIQRKNGKFDQDSKFLGGVQVRGSGSIGGDKEIIDGVIYEYVYFALTEFSDEYDNKVMYEISDKDIIEFELKDTVEEKELFYDDKDCEIIASPLGIRVDNGCYIFDNMKIVYKNGDEEFVSKDSSSIKKGCSSTADSGRTLIYLDDVSEEIHCGEIDYIVVNDKEFNRK